MTETIKKVKEVAQESDPKVSRTGCESSSPSSRVREGTLVVIKGEKEDISGASSSLEIVRIRHRSGVEADQ